MVARYKLAERCFIKPDDHLDAALHEAGFEFNYSGVPARNMVALNAEAEAMMTTFPALTVNQTNILPRRGTPAS